MRELTATAAGRSRPEGVAEPHGPAEAAHAMVARPRYALPGGGE